MNQNAYTYRCPSCGTKNRIPADKAGKKAKCGKCSGVLNTADLLLNKTVTVEDSNFADTVMRSPLPVLLDCWAPWCGPCKMIGPIMEELAGQWQGKVRVGKLNVDENPKIGDQFQIRSIPTLLVFDNGKLVNSLVGAQPKQAIAQAMASYL